MGSASAPLFSARAWRSHRPSKRRSLKALTFTLQSRGSIECSRFRKNVFAYAESHGLGQSGGGLQHGKGAHGMAGWADDYPPGSLMHELGSLLCRDHENCAELEPGVDEAAKLPNHFVTDIATWPVSTAAI